MARHVSYNSISQKDECGSIPAPRFHLSKSEGCDGSPNPRRPRRSVVVVLSLLVAMAISEVIRSAPTADEAAFLRQYNLPVMGNVRAVRSANRLAIASQSELLLEEGSMQRDMAEILPKEKQQLEHLHSQNDTHPPEGCEATVVIIRHCEKGDIREHCNYVGYERSVYLSTLFGDEESARWPAPSYIFALSPGGRHRRTKMNFREVETVGALASKVNVSVDYSYTESDTAQMARQILNFLETGSLCGKVVLVSWKHSAIGHLAHRLGCGPNQGCPLDYRGHSFDNTWQLKYVYRTLPHSHRKSLKLDREAEWRIFGNVQPENFDPLSFSKQKGDYNRNSANEDSKASKHHEQIDSGVIPGWESEVVEVPERESNHDKKTWDDLLDVAKADNK